MTDNTQRPADTIATQPMLGDGFMPLVQMQWGDKFILLTPEQARSLALNLIKAADTALYDASLYRYFLNDGKGNKPEVAAVLVKGFREYRASQGAAGPEVQE